MTDLALRYLLFGEDKSATSTIGKVGGAFSKVGSKIGGEFGEILNRVGEGIDHIGDHAHSMGAKVTGAGAVVSGLGVAFQLAGSKEQQGAAQLNAAIDATGKAHEDYEKKVEEAIKANEKFGFGAADTQQALAKLTAATNDPDKAIESMGLTANLAASQHISLSDASKMLARVMAGTGGRVLAQYGIQMDHTKSKTEAGQLATEELAKKLNGQAGAAVDSFGGKLRVWQTRVGDLTAQVGQKLGPALTVAGPSIMAIGTIVELGVVPAMGRWIVSTAAASASMVKNAALAVVSAVRYAAVTVATSAWTAAQWLLNTALNANPIALVVIGIAALIAVIILAWKHSETFRKVVTGAFHAVLSAVAAAWHWISDHWPLIFAILTGPVGLAVLWVTRHWSQVTDFFSKVPGRIKSALGTLAGILTAPFRLGFNAIADLWNGTVGQLSFHIPSWVPGIGGDGFSMPKLPHLARGGIVTKPTLLIAGEAGDEAIQPLSAGRDRLGGGDIHVHVDARGSVDPVGVGKNVEMALVKLKSANGNRPLAFQ